jgi:hypothetical protein
VLCRDDHILHARDDCEPANPDNTLTDRLNTLLNSSGPGYRLPLCPSTQYLIQAPILFFAENQEISTVGYPTGDERATLVVNGPVSNGQGHTTAIDGTCPNCDGVQLRNIQVRNLLHYLIEVLNLLFRLMAHVEEHLLLPVARISRWVVPTAANSLNTYTRTIQEAGPACTLLKATSLAIMSPSNIMISDLVERILFSSGRMELA